MKYKRNLIILFVILFTAGCSFEHNDNAKSELTTVKTYSVATKNISNNITYTGYVAADELKNFSFELAGKIEDVYVEKGDKICVGQTLAILDTTTVENTVDNADTVIKQAENAIAQADSNISEANIGIEQAENVIAETQIGIEAQKQTLEKISTNIETEELSLQKITDSHNSAFAKLQLSYDDLKKTYDDMLLLYNEGVVSESDFNKAKLAFDNISEELSNEKTTMENDIQIENNKLKGLRDDYKLQEIQIKNSEAKIMQAETSKKSAKTKLEQAQTQKKTAQIQLEQAEISSKQATDNLDKCTLKSTIDGYVVETPLKSGEVTAVGTPVVIVENGKSIINVSIPAEDYSMFEVGKNAQLRQDNISMTGTITSIDVYPDTTTRTYNMEITPERENEFAMGSIVTVNITTENIDSFIIPLSSIFDIDGVDYVYCIIQDENGNNIVSSKQITLGKPDGENVMVTGLVGNELIASDEVKYLHDNQIVQIAEE